MEQLDSKILLDFLGEVDKELRRSITLVAVGGTALTLLKVKASTIDVDFTIPSEDYALFKEALNGIPHGFKVDCWKDGIVFSQILPDDYLKRSIPIRRMKNVHLRALNPVDIVVTKIGRLDPRDKQDIETAIRRFDLRRSQVVKRAKQVEYVGREENYNVNLSYVLENFFK
jgi:hypothetical protein